MRMRTALLGAAFVAGMATVAAGQEADRGPRWDRIEDRLMGLVPHEFKALLAKKPS